MRDVQGRCRLRDHPHRLGGADRPAGEQISQRRAVDELHDQERLSGRI
jgi:hypothetical protein